LLVEPLELRATPATIIVNTLTDENTFGGSDPTLSLREAIELVNGTLAVASLSPAEQALVTGTPHVPNVADSVQFRVTGTINLASALPDITGELNLLGPGPNVLTVARSSAMGTPNAASSPWTAVPSAGLRPLPLPTAARPTAAPSITPAS
jgi:hypothetical protein